ncbi:MAG: UTP--glucose-1-phosphate uridylyltransferase [Polyangiaceae bacterium]|nr:UTP--glucose-1-phosphate uridylyltransferase [Polyangiaceae bacterium]
MNPWDADDLKQQLKKIPPATRELLQRHGFSEAEFLELVQKSMTGDERNFVSGKLKTPDQEDIKELPPQDSKEYQRLAALGEAALRAGECALVVLAGGMATRMGGVVKALVEPLPGASFLQMRLNEQKALAQQYGQTPPLWLMTSQGTHEKTLEALGNQIDGESLAVFEQNLSVRLRTDGQLWLNQNNAPGLYAPGHGDLPDALRRSGLLEKFRQRGGRYLFVTNLDNLGGGLDPLLIGYHLDQKKPVTCEVVEKRGSDRGGIPLKLDGNFVVLEEFRIPPSFDPQQVPVFNVNSFAFDVAALSDLNFDWTYFRVEKKVNETKVIQFERLLNEVTFHLATSYVKVPRSGPFSRFLPVKDFEELARRKGELQEIAVRRKMVETF